MLLAMPFCHAMRRKRGKTILTCRFRCLFVAHGGSRESESGRRPQFLSHFWIFTFVFYAVSLNLYGNFESISQISTKNLHWPFRCLKKINGVLFFKLRWFPTKTTNVTYCITRDHPARTGAAKKTSFSSCGMDCSGRKTASIFDLGGCVLNMKFIRKVVIHIYLQYLKDTLYPVNMAIINHNIFSSKCMVRQSLNLEYFLYSNAITPCRIMLTHGWHCANETLDISTFPKCNTQHWW